MKKIKILIISIFTVFIVCLVIHLKNPSFIYNSIEDLKSFVNHSNNVIGYKAKSLVVVDRTSDEIFISKKEEDTHLPASLAKLFVIDYANTFCDLDEEVLVKKEVLDFVKPNSSVAYLKNKRYKIKDLYAAMLVPSGNDAAYVIAEYLGGKLNNANISSHERIELFINGLNEYLVKSGYKDTVIYDPSGYDYDGKTSVLDLKKVSDNLLKNRWFREIVSKSEFICYLDDGTSQVWKNTNVFLDNDSDYFNKDVIGIKTGSLNNDYNLIVLYRKKGKEFLICSIGSETDSLRYEDVTYILKTIDESSYLK